MPRGDTKLLSRELSTGKSTDLFAGKSNEYDQVILRENYIFYQDRKSSEIIRYNPVTGEKKALVSNLSTYIVFLEMDIQNNKLFYYIDDQNADAYNKNPKDNESYYVDIDTGKNTKIGYRIACDNGSSTQFNRFIKETPEYYILPLRYIMDKQNYVKIIPIIKGVVKI
jgi:hypothetical protein